MTTKPEFPIWTVYYDTLDFPGLYTVRRFNMDVPTEEFYISKTLEGVRKHIPEGKVMLMPSKGDPKIIKEIWI
jgi:hypothetical protein